MIGISFKEGYLLKCVNKKKQLILFITTGIGES